MTEYQYDILQKHGINMPGVLCISQAPYLKNKKKRNDQKFVEETVYLSYT